MCQVVQCTRCKKWTWEGCGMHVQSVMKNIPVEKRCTCDKTKQKTESQKYQHFSSQSRYFTEPSHSLRR